MMSDGNVSPKVKEIYLYFNPAIQMTTSKLYVTYKYTQCTRILTNTFIAANPLSISNY